MLASTGFVDCIFCGNVSLLIFKIESKGIGRVGWRTLDTQHSGGQKILNVSQCLLLAELKHHWKKVPEKKIVAWHNVP